MLIDSGANGGIKVALEIPTGATMHVISMVKKDQEHHHSFNWLKDNSSYNEWGSIDNTLVGHVLYRGIITIGGTSGTVKIRWAQSNADATPTRVIADSYMKITRIQ
jgi:hypothetical protein